MQWLIAHLVFLSTCASLLRVASIKHRSMTSWMTANLLFTQKLNLFWRTCISLSFGIVKKFLCSVFRPSATVSRIGLMESRLCRCRGGPPSQLADPPGWLPPPRDGWLGRSAFALTKRTCYSRCSSVRLLRGLSLPKMKVSMLYPACHNVFCMICWSIFCDHHTKEKAFFPPLLP